MKTNSTTKPLEIAVVVSCCLVVFKFIVGMATSSMAILASAVDSLTDVGMSFINLLAAREAVKPPDEHHEYGHGKIESLAGLFQSLLVMATGLFLIFESFRRLASGAALERIPAGILAMAVSLLVTFFLSGFLSASAKSGKSHILETETLHYSGDLWTGVAIIAALALVQVTGVSAWDLLLSFVVSGYLFWNASKILKRCVDELLDRSLDTEERASIEKIIFAHDNRIVGIHNFRGRRVGEQIFVDFHIEIRSEKDFAKAHGLTESLISHIKQTYPNADVTVHYDPEGAE
ncbi:MAG TPA: cation diffusion facilitator family transporter [Verrucomicrobiae bacterium]|jgi:cation diffusion facilitator family transporter|nr:cation diffusion facilitator family transporter [Verrucomicrobiae bacterium]